MKPLLILLALAASVSAQMATLTLGWDSTGQWDVSTYRVYLGSSSGKYSHKFTVNDALSITLSIQKNVNYFAAVSSVDKWGFEGPLSPEYKFNSKSRPRRR
jgi:hypothetical protein